AGAEQHVLVLARRLYDLQEITPDLVIHEHFADGLLAAQHFIGRGGRRQLLDRVYVLNPFEHLVLFVQRWVAEAQPDKKAVELRLGQGKRAFVIDRVLRGDDEEGRLEGIRLAVDGDAAFGHRLQEGRLRARRGAVDLVGQDDLREDRPGAKLELRRL